MTQALYAHMNNKIKKKIQHKKKKRNFRNYLHSLKKRLCSGWRCSFVVESMLSKHDLGVNSQMGYDDCAQSSQGPQGVTPPERL
jgi:hypothetical protein